MASAREQQPSLTATAGRRGRFQKPMPEARASLGARKAVLLGFEGAQAAASVLWPLAVASP